MVPTFLNKSCAKEYGLLERLSLFLSQVSTMQAVPPHHIIRSHKNKLENHRKVGWISK